MTTPDNAYCAAVDWGTSGFRLWLVDVKGEILGERRSREGMQVAAAGAGFEPILEAHLSALNAPADLPVIICGMAGARQGWIEAPYVDAPADLAAITRGAIRVPGITRDVRILPGVAQRPDANGIGADVIRGEETQVMGLGLEGLLCLPGTHSKWVEAGSGRISGFSTFMTGEMFALLSEQSILRHSIDPASDVLAERAAFLAGLSASLGAPAAILNRLFSLRASGLFGDSTPAEARSRLSGLVIGLEIAGAQALYPDRSTVALAASGPLRDLYLLALAEAGFTTSEADADAAVRKGLLAAARYCFGTFKD